MSGLFFADCFSVTALRRLLCRCPFCFNRPLIHGTLYLSVCFVVFCLRLCLNGDRHEQEERWQCIQCNHPYERSSIELSLVEAVQRRRSAKTAVGTGGREVGIPFKSQFNHESTRIHCVGFGAQDAIICDRVITLAQLSTIVSIKFEGRARGNRHKKMQSFS